MNLLLATWRCIIALLCFPFKGGRLLPAECVDIVPLGRLTAEPATLFLMGSNLTVYCHVFECQQGSKMYLEVITYLEQKGNQKVNQRVNLSKRVNCTTTVFYLPRVETRRSHVVCTMKSSQLSAPQVISGLDLRAGLPPDKPGVISCETTRSSDWIDCWLIRGRDTHLNTSYNISVHRGNESLLDLTQNGDKISLPRAILEENTTYTLTATASNHFGAARSEPFIFSLTDIAIPETPQIVKVEFLNESTSATLTWETSDSSMLLTPQIRIQANNTWEQRAGAGLGEGQIRVENLRPLTEYQFQIKTCASPSGRTPDSTPSFKARQTSPCSKWSQSVRRRSPGKGPSQQLDVWRSLGDQVTHGLRNITVFWKPPPSEDYSGELLNCSILLDNGREMICAAASTQCLLQAPVELRALTVSAVNSYGTSPPAFVDLRHAGASESFSVKLAPTADGSAARVSWSSTGWKEHLYFVIEWESLPAGSLQWKKVLKDLNDTTIIGLMAGVRYNVSLYAVTTRGVGSPASSLIYSREQKPLSAPVLHVLTYEARRVLIRWDELPLDHQRGFITNYTVYLQTVDSSGTELNVTASGSGPRQMWLDCSGGTLSLQLTASNSAGEGPRGKQILCQPAAPAAQFIFPTSGLVIGIVFIVTIFAAIVANLMCWSCVRKRIKQKCIAWGPEWLVDSLPKPGHSNAIRLLEDERSEILFSSTYSDPPLSPILVISEEEGDEVYPTFHVEEFQVGIEHAATDLSMSDTITIPVEHTGYKPQIVSLIPVDDDQRGAPENTDEEIEGLPRNFFTIMGMGCSDLSHRVSLDAIGDFLGPNTAETSVLKGVCLQKMSGTDEGWKNGVSFLDELQNQEGTLDSDDIGFSPLSASTIPSSGYFPQMASLSAVTLDTMK